MATIGRIGDYGRDSKGHWKPDYMTHAELCAELESATGERRTELRTEATSRMRYSNYPPFPAHLGLSPE